MRFVAWTSALFALLVVACGGGTTPAVREPAPTGSPAETVPPSEGPTDASPGGEELPEAPDFSMETLEGDTFRLSDHRGELPVVLNFWAPW